MITINLYRYIRPDGGITVSPQMPTGVEYTLMYRLVADDGKILVNGDTQTYCVDVDHVDGWEEVEDD